MSKTPKILVFGGSLRRDSFNQKLAAIAAEPRSPVIFPVAGLTDRNGPASA
jgi:hypothetical protein